MEIDENLTCEACFQKDVCATAFMRKPSTCEDYKLTHSTNDGETFDDDADFKLEADNAQASDAEELKGYENLIVDDSGIESVKFGGNFIQIKRRCKSDVITLKRDCKKIIPRAEFTVAKERFANELGLYAGLMIDNVIAVIFSFQIQPTGERIVKGLGVKADAETDNRICFTIAKNFFQERRTLEAAATLYKEISLYFAGENAQGELFAREQVESIARKNGITDAEIIDNVSQALAVEDVDDAE